MVETKVNIEYAVQYWMKNNLYDFDFVLLMLSDNTILQSMFTSKLHNRKGTIIHGEEAKLLLCLYSFYEFSNNLIIGSLALPFGRKLYNLIDCGIATEEEIINDVILGAM